jgi:hypothetical protein
MKYGTVWRIVDSERISVSFYHCLLDNQLHDAELYQSIKAVLIKNLHAKNLGIKIEQGRDTHRLILPRSLISKLNFYDAAAHHLAVCAAARKMSEVDMADELAKFEQTSLVRAEGRLSLVTRPDAEVLSPVRFFSHFLKSGWKVQGSPIPVGFGRTNPMWVHYTSKQDPTERKTVLKKEASYTQGLLSRIEKGIYQEKDVLELLNENLNYGFKDQYDGRQLKAALNNDYQSMDEDSKKRISKLVPLLNNLPNRFQELAKTCSPVVHRERVYALIASFFVRILVGPCAPKGKLLDAEQGSPDYLHFLSAKVPNAKDLVSLSETAKGAKLLARHAPKIAACALFCYGLGREDFENKPENYLFVPGVLEPTIVPIDLDCCFGTTHAWLRDLELSSAGARALFPLRSSSVMDKETKEYWDNLFHEGIDTEIRIAMIGALDRMAQVLTPTLIKEVVNRICSSHPVLALSEEDSSHIISFLVESSRIARAKLGANFVPKNPLSLAPWVERIMQEIQDPALQQHSSNSNFQ